MTTLKEIRKIKGYENEYMVSDDGQVFRVLKNGLKVLAPVIDKDGYYRVTLCKGNVKKTYPIHRLVAGAFIKKKHVNETVINHKDENKTNNNVSNLEWCTVKYNTNYNGTAYRRAKSRKRAVKAISENDEFYFDSATDAARELNISRGNIFSCLNGKRKTAGGFIWEYVKG